MKYFENDVVLFCDNEEATILFESGVDKYIILTEFNMKYEVDSIDIKLIKPHLMTRISNLKKEGYDIIKCDFKVLDTIYGQLAVYDIKISKNDYIFSCFADTETVIKQMKIDGLL